MKNKSNNTTALKIASIIMATMITASMAACDVSDTPVETAVTATQSADDTSATEADIPIATEATAKPLSESDITINDTIENTTGGAHAILANGESLIRSNTKVVKSGGSGRLGQRRL